MWTMPSIPDSHKRNIFKYRTALIWNKNMAFQRHVPYMPWPPIAMDTRWHQWQCMKVWNNRTPICQPSGPCLSRRQVYATHVKYLHCGFSTVGKPRKISSFCVETGKMWLLSGSAVRRIESTQVLAPCWLERLEHLVLSVRWSPNHCLLTSLMSPDKDPKKKCKSIDWIDWLINNNNSSNAFQLMTS